MSESLFANKLETAFVAWLNTNKGSDLSGVTICSARATTEQAPPYIAVLCQRAPKHPDFASVPGASYPRRAEVAFVVVSHGREGAFSAKAGQWAAELQRILTGADGKFTTLISDLNPATPDNRTVTGLRIYSIALMDESSTMVGSEWHETLVLEVDGTPADGT